MINTIYSLVNERNKLWVKDKDNKNIGFILDKQKLKVKSKNNELVYNNFIWTKDKIFWEKNEKIKGYINLNYIGLYYSKKDLKIELFSNTKIFTIFFDDLIFFLKWKSVIISNSIQNDLSNKFKVIIKWAVLKKSYLYLFEKISKSKKFLVKIIKKTCWERGNDYNIFLQEIKLLKTFNHKNIIKIKYLYEDNKSFYIFFKYFNLIPLNEYLELKKNSFKEKINIIIKIIQGIKYLHSKDVIHKDLKPNHILLGYHEKKLKLKIIDFKYSYSAANKNLINDEKKGTWGYIAPEILNENVIDFSNDIYSLGHIIYNIFTNKNLFSSKDIEELLMKNKNNEYNWSSIKNDSIKLIIGKCLISDKSKRIDITGLEKLINSLIP